MSELNREQIIKALEHCIKDDTCEQCPYSPSTCHIQEDALSLINKLTEENEAWQKQLISTEEKADKAYYELACEVEDLRAENERLHASCTELERKCASLTEENERLTDDNKWSANRIIETDKMVWKLNAENERLRVEEKQYQTLINTLHDKLDEGYAKFVDEERADTVREMQERLEEYLDDYYHLGEDALLDVHDLIDQIAKEMLEGEG